ncbi:prepilin-type N-terminal cleavage/methylation domain-containing protein [Methylobacterium durans]|uniref:GspH/FimT family pseudopilin n=1 Tax=Methylobacterium durans TaxID=2202825 RepID=UPI002AFE49F0|nr:GspH/FimT family pseudopilin [Methylobacterium durans]MEA1832116.1 prepilin-type N-terminal cleavage/methylation domain-containing protein [Methylobacterium durans]
MSCPRPAHRCADASGFSLVEMLVVLAILALAASLSAPVLSRVASDRGIESLGERLAEHLALTRAAAIRGNAVLSLAFDPRAPAFRGGTGAPLTVPPGVAVDFRAHPSARAGEMAVLFLPDGRSSGGTFRLERAGAVREIAVERLTGSVRRQRGGTE